MESKRRKPTEAELAILRVLWEGKARSVRAIQEVLNESRPTGYTTVLKLMQTMAEKGLVKRDEKQRAHIYSASRPREWTQRQLAGDLLERAFAGSASSLLVGALAARKASAAELAELRKLVGGYEDKP